MIRFYHGLRRDVSLLLEAGHQHAPRYVIAFVWSEARIVRQRLTMRRKLDTTLLQMAISSVMSVKAGKHLAKIVKKLDEND